MELTVVQPIKVRMPHGPQDFTPGEIIDLPDKVAQRLMELAPGKVRLVELHPHSNVWIDFVSPLLGRCTAKIQSVTLDRCVITDYSVLRKEEGMTIPASWIYGMHQEQ